MKSYLTLGLWLLYLVGHAASSNHSHGTTFLPPFCFEWSSPAPVPDPGGYNLEGTCVGGDAGLLTTGIWLSYSANFSVHEGQPPQTYWNRIWIEYNSTAPSLTYQDDSSQLWNMTRVEYTFVQPEHGGGKCNCLKIFFNHSCKDARQTYGELCDESARVPRQLKVVWSPDTGFNIVQLENDFELKVLPFQLNCGRNKTRLVISYTVFTSADNNCDPIDTFAEGIELSVHLSSIDEWIPLIFAHSSDMDMNNPQEIRGYRVDKMQSLQDDVLTKMSIDLCNFSFTDIIQFRWLQSTEAILSINYPRDVWSLDNIEVYVESGDQRCHVLVDSFENDTLSNSNWRHSSIRNGNVNNYCSRNSEALVFGQNTIDLNGHYWINTSRALLTEPLALCHYPCIRDAFDECSYISSTSTVHVHGFSMSTTTSDRTASGITSIVRATPVMEVESVATSDLLLEHTESMMASLSGGLSTSVPEDSTTMKSTSQGISHLSTIMSINTQSTQIVSPTPTRSINLPTLSTTVTDINSTITSKVSATVATSEDAGAAISDTLNDQEAIAQLESMALELISKDRDLQEILTTSDNKKRLYLLRNITLGGDKPVLAITYLLFDTLNAISKNTSADHDIIQVVLQIGNAIVENSGGLSSLSETSATIVGTTLLLAIDQAAATSAYRGVQATSNIVLDVEVLNVGRADQSDFTSIDTSSLKDWPPPHASISIPQKEFEIFTANDALTTLATTYRNVSVLFPVGRQKVERDELVSEVIGTSIQCGTATCRTSNLTLKSPVRIYFEHSTMLKEKLNSSSEILCVFLDIPKRNRSVFNLGHWSQRGCSKNSELSSKTRTVCECDHLTHFAILLSSNPPEFDHHVEFSLMIIGYVGVAVSLVAMALTVLSFALLRTLHTMRNFVTANLCISLSVAQIMFIAGIDKTGELHGNVPIHCRVIAVLLHYFFLVSFMWMLMEGVFLYLTLVRVFVSHTKRYLVAFMVTCYGLPVLYMGVLTLPLGFGVSTGPHYGYKRACFLRPDSFFVWALIAPVILIFIANIGFFIMAGVIMWRHHMKLKDKNKFQNICSWLRSALSLVVIMGLTWIMGLLVVEVDELIPLAYIYTILVAFQGLFIFLMYVVFSKVVHQAYIKWWKAKVNKSDLLSKYFGQSLHSSGLKSKSHSSGSRQTTIKTTNGSEFNKINLANISETATNSIRLSTIENENENEPVISDFSFVLGSSILEEPQIGSGISESFNSCDSRNVLI